MFSKSRGGQGSFRNSFSLVYQGFPKLFEKQYNLKAHKAQLHAIYDIYHIFSIDHLKLHPLGCTEKSPGKPSVHPRAIPHSWNNQRHHQPLKRNNCKLFAKKNSCWYQTHHHRCGQYQDDITISIVLNRDYLASQNPFSLSLKRLLGNAKVAKEETKLGNGRGKLRVVPWDGRLQSSLVITDTVGNNHDSTKIKCTNIESKWKLEVWQLINVLTKNTKGHHQAQHGENPDQHLPSGAGEEHRARCEKEVSQVGERWHLGILQLYSVQLTDKHEDGDDEDELAITGKPTGVFRNL